MTKTLEELRQIALHITGECTCDEGYKCRNLIDPQCVHHECFEDIVEALRAAEQGGHQRGVESELANVAERCAEAARVGERRGIERAAELMFLQGHESVISTKQAYNAIRALAQGGEK